MDCSLNLTKLTVKHILGKLGASYSTVVVSLTLACCLMSAQLLSYSASSMGQGEIVRWKSSWVEIKTGRLSTSYYHGQNRLTLGKIALL